MAIVSPPLTWRRVAMVASVVLGAAQPACSFFALSGYDDDPGPAPEGADAAAGKPLGPDGLYAGEGGTATTTTKGIVLRGIEKDALTPRRSLSIPVPPAAQPGDVLVLAVLSLYNPYAIAGSFAPTTPGWRTHVLNSSFFVSCNTNHRAWVGSRVLAQGDPTKVDFVVGDDARFDAPLGAILLAYGGVGDAPIDNDSPLTFAASDVFSAPALTVTTPSATVLRFFALGTSYAPYVTKPAVDELTSIGPLAVFTSTQDAPGTAPAIAFTMSRTGACSATTLSLALRAR